MVGVGIGMRCWLDLAKGVWEKSKCCYVVLVVVVVVGVVDVVVVVKYSSIFIHR